LMTRMSIAILSAKVPKANLTIPKDSNPQE
jgi:hypothetical protein